MNAAAMARQNKLRRPDDFCRSPNCLWRVQSRTGATPCPRHPVPGASTVDAYFNDPEFGERRRLARAKNYACPWCGSTIAHCADRECPGAPSVADATGST